MRVVVTRAVHQAEELARPLRDLGAEVILLPVIGIAPPLDVEPLRRAALECDSYDWIIFSSSNAFESFASYLTRVPEARIATVGAATRETVERRGLSVSVSPSTHTAEALVEALAEQDLEGSRILIPSAAVTRDVIAPALRGRGATVDVVEAYRNVVPAEAAAGAAAVFREPPPDWVTFASSSAVANLAGLIGTSVLQSVQIASIGPSTSVTIREHGLEPAIEAEEHSVKGLVKVLSIMLRNQ